MLDQMCDLNEDQPSNSRPESHRYAHAPAISISRSNDVHSVDLTARARRSCLSLGRRREIDEHELAGVAPDEESPVGLEGVPANRVRHRQRVRATRDQVRDDNRCLDQRYEFVRAVNLGERRHQDEEATTRAQQPFGRVREAEPRTVVFALARLGTA